MIILVIAKYLGLGFLAGLITSFAEYKADYSLYKSIFQKPYFKVK